MKNTGISWPRCIETGTVVLPKTFRIFTVYIPLFPPSSAVFAPITVQRVMDRYN
jgi:hypothetical protein